MAAVAVQIRGTLYDLLSRTSRQVLLQGEASLLGLEIGGGPMPGGGSPVDPSYGIPIERPEHPIVQPPPGIWGPNDPRPTPPIYLPPDITPPDPPAGGADKPPPDAGGWGYVAEWNAWGYFPGPGQAGPK